jgi:hypothetical protein
MEDAETGAVQRKAVKLSTAVAQQSKGPPTTAAPSRRWQVNLTVSKSPLGSSDYRRSVRSSDAGPRSRILAVLGPFLWGGRFAEQGRWRIGKKALRHLADPISPERSMRALTPQGHPIMLNHCI